MNESVVWLPVPLQIALVVMLFVNLLLFGVSVYAGEGVAKRVAILGLTISIAIFLTWLVSWMRIRLVLWSQKDLYFLLNFPREWLISAASFIIGILGMSWWGTVMFKW